MMANPIRSQLVPEDSHYQHDNPASRTGSICHRQQMVKLYLIQTVDPIQHAERDHVMPQHTRCCCWRPSDFVLGSQTIAFGLIKH